MGAVNLKIAEIFSEIADLLEIQSANPFRVRAYRNAARTIGELGTDVTEWIARGKDLRSLPGIGEDLAAKVREIINTGESSFLKRQQQALPPAITQLLRLPGLGPKRVRLLHDELGVQSLEELVSAAREGRIRDVPGFGPKTEQRIVEAIQRHLGEATARRLKLSTATQYAQALTDHLCALKVVRRVDVAGSFRRVRETVGDLDILVIAEDSAAVMQRLAAYSDVQKVLSAGPTRGSVLLRGGLQVDVRIIEPESYGAALQYFTGSKAHNIAVRRLAQERGLKMNEYGVFRGRKRVAGDSEESVYAAVGLPWIPPELREDRGEVEAAQEGSLPNLIELSDLRGDLHVHTKASDGHNTPEEMALAAQAEALEYIAITDHSRHLTVAHGLDPIRLGKQIDEIKRLNNKLTGVAVLSGVEVDILEDGSLDLPDSTLSRLDIVVAAVHSKFDLPRNKQTARILKAMDNPHVRLLAHPTGRLIGEREPYEADVLRIIRHAKSRGVCLELNAQPERLDLSEAHCRMAKDEGVQVCISSDAHSTLGFVNLRWGVGQARRGWLEKADILNTRTLRDLRKWLKAKAG